MKHILCSTMKNYKKEYLPKDIFSGIIMAAVSIPISMGYAQIAGLPAVYGLYGSVFPILFFALFSTSLAIHFRSRCGTGGNCRSSTGITWNSKRK